MLKSTDIKKFEELNFQELPKDIISETGLIGTLIVHTDYILKSEYIKPSFFYNRELGCIYHIIETLYKKGIENIDTFLIATEIGSNNSYKETFEEIRNINDIPAYLEDLKCVARNTLEEYELLANKVATASFKRSSYIELKVIQEEIIKSKDDINEINYNLQSRVSDFSNIYVCNKEVLSLGEVADEIYANIVEKQSTGFFGFPSKFEKVNDYMTYEKTELVMVAAPGKTGKTHLLSNETWAKAMNGVPSLYIDREMSTENHLIRFLSFLTGFEPKKIKTGDLTIIEEKLIKEKLQYIKTLPYYHVYKPTADIHEMYMDIKGLVVKKGIEFLTLDYIKANDGSDSDKEYQKLGRQTDWLKNEVAGGLNLATLSACQMDDKGLKVADSQKILRNCSTLLYLTRKTNEEIVEDGGLDASGNMKLFVRANRNGESMTEDEYLNLCLWGNKCKILQAKNPYTKKDNTPFQLKGEIIC